jgi:hypothetical protein
MYHVVICTKEYQGPFGTKVSAIFKKGEIYQAENHGEEYRVWRSASSFLKLSPSRFRKFFRIFC